ncbi:MAG: light-harvesting protein [Gemmatimonadaceae bacterium]|jgi:light-harvesting complex 1 beta chain|nr:light-harvesting protein [Gemmatimonadaceae bacterium]
MEQSNITEAEAKAFNGYFLVGFIGFTGVAIFAHFLAWMWRPWF